MREQVRFTEQEKKHLRKAMKNGGIFLKIFDNPDAKVEVLATDGNGGWKTIESLDKNISSKINALYNGQKTYKAPLVLGFRQVSLSWFIAEYC